MKNYVKIRKYMLRKNMDYTNANGGKIYNHIYFAYLYFILLVHCTLLNINKIKSYLLMLVNILIDRTFYSKMAGTLNSIHRSCHQ